MQPGEVAGLLQQPHEIGGQVGILGPVVAKVQAERGSSNARDEIVILLFFSVMSEPLTKIRIRTLSTQTQTVRRATLGGIACGFRFRWLAGVDRWVVWILDAADEVLVGPEWLVPGIDLLAGHQHNPAVPRGQLFVHSAPATRENVDEGAELLWRAPS